MRFYRWGIGLYQKHLSPRKGYRCAHSLEHGGSGCSGAVLEILEAKGFLRGFGDIRARFVACQDAAEKRQRRREEDQARRQREKDKGGGGGGSGGSSNSGCCVAEALDDSVNCALDAARCKADFKGCPDTPDCTPDCSPDFSCSSIRIFKAKS